MRRISYTAVIAALLFLASTQVASAQVPAPVRAGKLTYVTGGIGESEVTAMRTQARAYSALIEFVEIEPGNPRGVWTADLAVTVKSG